MTADKQLVRMMIRAVLGYYFRGRISSYRLEDLNYQTWVCMRVREDEDGK